MQEDSKTKKGKLIILYSSYYLNKISITIFLLTLVLLTTIFIVSANHGANDLMYHTYYEEIHKGYFADVFFALTIIIALFSSFLGALEGSTNISKVDALILGKVSRATVVVYKTLSFLLINTIYYIIVFAVLFIVPMIMFQRFNFQLEYLNILVDLIIWGSFIVMFSMLLSMIMQNYFAPLLSFIIFFISKIISDSTDPDIIEIANIVFPQLTLERTMVSSFLFDRIFIINYIFVLILITYLYYSKKDLKV